MSEVTIPVPTTSGTVVDVTSWPATGQTGRKVTAGDSYDQYALSTTLGRAYFFTIYGEQRSAFSGLSRIFHLIDTGGEAVCSLRVSSAGALQMFDGEGEAKGGSIDLDLDHPYVIDISVLQNTEGPGVVTVRVNNEVITDALSTTLTNTKANRLRVGINTGGASNADGWVSRVVAINDDQGAAPDNTFKVTTIYPAPPATLIPSGPKRRLGIPIGWAQVNNTQLRTNEDRIAQRFVPAEDMYLHRFLMGFNLEGVDKNSKGEEAPSEINPKGTGRTGYGDGNGGVFRASIVPCASDGTPSTATTLAADEFNCVDRYEESFEELTPGATAPNQFLFLDFGVQLTGGKLYAVVIQNIDAAPLNNWSSINFPTASIAAAGPHRVNTTSKFAKGAMGGMDPRECVFWSVDSGAHYFIGERVGGDTEAQGIIPPRTGGHVSGYYSGFSELDPDEKVRLPWYGFQAEDGTVTGIQPYYNYVEEVTAPVLRNRKAGRKVTLKEAAAYAPTGKEAKVLTVKNLRTGVSGKTSSLGSGLVKGTLDTPVPIAAGDTYTVSATGTVYLEQADSFQQTIFGLGGGDWPFTTDGHESDRAALCALPHPYFAEPGAAPAGGQGRETRIGSHGVRPDSRIRSTYIEDNQGIRCP